MNKQKKNHMNAAERLDNVRRLSRDALLIGLGIQHDGAVYSIHPLGMLRMKERYPDVVPLEDIMLGHTRAADFEKLNPLRWEPMVLMLTGLTPEQLADLGGVRIYNTEDGGVVWEWKPEIVRS